MISYFQESDNQSDSDIEDLEEFIPKNKFDMLEKLNSSSLSDDDKDSEETSPLKISGLPSDEEKDNESMDDEEMEKYDIHIGNIVKLHKLKKPWYIVEVLIMHNGFSAKIIIMH